MTDYGYTNVTQVEKAFKPIKDGAYVVLADGYEKEDDAMVNQQDRFEFVLITRMG